MNSNRINFNEKHRSEKLLIISETKEDLWKRQHRRDKQNTEKNERQLQDDLWVLIHHNGILIDGDKLLKDLNETHNSWLIRTYIKYSHICLTRK